MAASTNLVRAWKDRACRAALSVGATLVLACGTASASALSNAVIDVDFTAGTSPLQAGAAVIGSSGDVWNNLNNPYLSGTPISVSGVPLEYANSSPSPVKLSYTAELATQTTGSAPYVSPFAGGPFVDLMGAYLIADPTEPYLDYGGGPGSVTFTGLTPGGSYNLYLYSGADMNAQGRATTFTLGSTKLTAAFNDAVDTFAPDVNYVEFSNVVASGGSISFSYDGSPGAEADLNGIQLTTAVPEPAAASTLLLVAGAMLGVRRPRNS